MKRAGDVAFAGVQRLEALGYEEGAASLRCTTAYVLAETGAWEHADRMAAEVAASTRSAITPPGLCSRSAGWSRRAAATTRPLTRMLDEAHDMWSPAL